ncbi:Putative AC transposase [Linum perenne]
MARDVLAVPISSVASDSAFSTRGRVLRNFHSSLTPAIVEALIYTIILITSLVLFMFRRYDFELQC